MKEKVKKTYKGITVEYTEEYSLNCEVNEDSGKRQNNIVKYYTKEQAKTNLEALKKAFE